MISSKYGFLLNPQAMKSVVDLLVDFKFNKIHPGDIPEDVYNALKSLRGLGSQKMTTIDNDSDDFEDQTSIEDFTHYIKSQILPEILTNNDMDLKKKLETLSKWKDLLFVVENEMSLKVRKNFEESEKLKKELVNKNLQMEFILSSIKTVITPKMTEQDRIIFFQRLENIIKNQENNEDSK